MTTTLIDGIILEQKGGCVSGVDARVYRWLEQWLSKEEARRLIYSLSWKRLTWLVCAYHSTISQTKVFDGLCGD